MYEGKQVVRVVTQYKKADLYNIAVVSQFLGNASIEETLDTYTHMFKDKLSDAVNTIYKLTYPAPSI